MAYIALARWRIEECFKFAKDQLGLGEYEVRSWHGWHRHITLVLAAQTFLTVLRSQAEPVIAPPAPPFTAVTTCTMTAFKAARGLLSGWVFGRWDAGYLDSCFLQSGALNTFCTGFIGAVLIKLWLDTTITTSELAPLLIYNCNTEKLTSKIALKVWRGRKLQAVNSGLIKKSTFI